MKSRHPPRFSRYEPSKILQTLKKPVKGEILPNQLKFSWDDHDGVTRPAIQRGEERRSSASVAILLAEQGELPRVGRRDLEDERRGGRGPCRRSPHSVVLSQTGFCSASVSRRRIGDRIGVIGDSSSEWLQKQSLRLLRRALRFARLFRYKEQTLTPRNAVRVCLRPRRRLSHQRDYETIYRDATETTTETAEQLVLGNVPQLPHVCKVLRTFRA
ncbi:hypothetical protein THAOC_01736 [Thalassiosira oceanica]|uniref:Uncharacterized protein n=1 Tax=Thalassiosira oceanica TaxID=159749 RepID=K0THL3_THAOC|nr:hypothetical protein THAOC_01736 [Thalassiosira oceanica]|eukprot:EJK76499.1 hypothetical protein THAOC_01736 [Thalassiosira oceanica]